MTSYYQSTQPISSINYPQFFSYPYYPPSTTYIMTEIPSNKKPCSPKQGNKSPSRCGDWSEPITYSLLIFIIIIIIGFIINIILLFRLPNFNKIGTPVTNDAKVTASIIGFGFTLVLSSIFGGWIYYHCLKCGYISGWVMIGLSIVVGFLITYLSALLMGIWIEVDHLWASNTLIPVTPPLMPIQ